MVYPLLIIQNSYKNIIMKKHGFYIAIFTVTMLFACSGDDNNIEDDRNMENDSITIADFDLLTVANNSNEVSLLPTLTWQKAITSDGSEVNYTVYLDSNSNPSNKILTNGDNSSIALVDKLKLNTDYFWRVEASSGALIKSSSTFGFTTRNLDTDTPALTTNAAFPERSNHSSLYFDSKFWVIAGSGNGRKNDVWNSTDGINWTLVTANAEFSPRTLHTSLVFDNKMWVIGGNALDENNNSLLKNDIWHSTDGITWVEANKEANFDGRFSHTSVVFNNKMWVIGGFSSANPYQNDVWSSDDGINWSQIILNADFSARNALEAFVFDDKMYIAGGGNIDRLNDVWSTTNGSDWIEETATASFAPRVSHKTVLYDNKIWLIGGIDDNGNFLNDVWYTTNGQNWLQATDNALFTGRIGHTVTANESGIFIIAGSVGSVTNPQNDIWILD